MFGKGSPDRVNDTRDYKMAVPANCTRPTHCVELVNCFSSLGNGVLLQHALQAGTFLWPNSFISVLHVEDATSNSRHTRFRSGSFAAIAASSTQSTMGPSWAVQK